MLRVCFSALYLCIAYAVDLYDELCWPLPSWEPFEPCESASGVPPTYLGFIFLMPRHTVARQYEYEGKRLNDGLRRRLLSRYGWCSDWCPGYALA